MHLNASAETARAAARFLFRSPVVQRSHQPLGAPWQQPRLAAYGLAVVAYRTSNKSVDSEVRQLSSTDRACCCTSNSSAGRRRHIHTRGDIDTWAPPTGCYTPANRKIQYGFPARACLCERHSLIYGHACSTFAVSSCSAFHAATNPNRQHQQHQRQGRRAQQPQGQQQLPAAAAEPESFVLPEGIAFPNDYVTPRSATSSGSSTKETNDSSNNTICAVELLGMLPAWARRLFPPRSEIVFLRVLPMTPLLAMALGVHLLPPLGFASLARDCLSAVIGYSAVLLAANAAVHPGMQLAELGFPTHRQHRGFYTVGRLGVSLFFVVHSLLVCGLLHDEPLNGIYLCCASALGLLGVDYLVYKKATTPLWFFAERRRLCIWMLIALGIAALSEQQTIESQPARPLLG